MHCVSKLPFSAHRPAQPLCCQRCSVRVMLSCVRSVSWRMTLRLNSLEIFDVLTIFQRLHVTNEPCQHIRFPLQETSPRSLTHCCYLREASNKSFCLFICASASLLSQEGKVGDSDGASSRVEADAATCGVLHEACIMQPLTACECQIIVSKQR